MSSDYHSEIAGVINADEIQVGKGVVIEDGVLITGEGLPARLQPSLKFLTMAFSAVRSRSRVYIVVSLKDNCDELFLPYDMKRCAESYLSLLEEIGKEA